MNKDIDRLRELYARKIPAGPVVDGFCFPAFSFLGEMGVHAFQAHFMVRGEDWERIEGLIRQKGFSAAPGTGLDEKTLKSPAGDLITMTWGQEFNGYSIHLVTNSSSFMTALLCLKVAPPSPWEVFPDVDPETLGSLQGSIDFWWRNYWMPFWNSLDETEKEQDLATRNAKKEWVEFIKTHEEWV
jgi:hypothetical protein